LPSTLPVPWICSGSASVDPGGVDDFFGGYVLPVQIFIVEIVEERFLATSPK